MSSAAGWSPTVDNYLGRVTKARILQAVREAKGEQAAATHRSSQERRDGGEGARAARRLGLAARTVAHARPTITTVIAVDPKSKRAHRPSPVGEDIGGDRLRNGHGRFRARRPKMSRSRQSRTLSRPSNNGVMRHPRARRQRRAFFISEATMQRKPPISRAASPSRPRRSAGTISPTAGVQAATGSSATFATRRDDPCSSG